MLLQFITHATSTQSILKQSEEVLLGGCKWIQLRYKTANEKELLECAIQLKKLCEKYQAKLIINDHAELCKKVKAEGLHLGLNDLPIQKARKIIGKNVTIGGTANTFNEVLYQINQGADYLGVGPFTDTQTKSNLSTRLGIAGYQKIMKQLNDRKLSIPILAIGGITNMDIPKLMHTGISGIALSSYLIKDLNTQLATNNSINLIKEHKL